MNTTLLAALCGLTALSLAGCDAHTLTARLPGANSTGPAPSSAPAGTGVAAAAIPAAAASPGAAQQDHTATDAAYERLQEKGCDEPGGCYYGVRLVGYPIEEAKRRAFAFGYKGEISLDDSYSNPECKAGTVCRIAPANWPMLNEDLTFYVNYAPRDLKINKPE